MRVKFWKLARWMLVVHIVFFLFVILNGCKQKQERQGKNTYQDLKTNHKVTFIELGSVNCVPCRKMQPVMKTIEEKFADQVKVIFYDVWKPNQRKYAQMFGIRLIPTQVFLDGSGKEFYRHEGFFPEYEIETLLAKRGLKIIKRPDF